MSKSWQTFIFENVFETCLQLQALQNVLKCHCLRCRKKTGLEDRIIANVEELLLKSVIKGWYQLFRFLLPFAKKAWVDFDAPLPSIEQEPYKRRPLLHNLICTEHFNWGWNVGAVIPYLEIFASREGLDYLDYLYIGI